MAHNSFAYCKLLEKYQKGYENGPTMNKIDQSNSVSKRGRLKQNNKNIFNESTFQDGFDGRIHCICLYNKRCDATLFIYKVTYGNQRYEENRTK